MEPNSRNKFLDDIPLGEDLFEGKSQELTAKNIANYIRFNQSSKRRVIGIEGEWGSGKSNVIEILRQILRDDHHIFLFDAWGHQEDLTRRSFLEELIEDLINVGLLKDEWKKEMDLLLAKKKTGITKTVPRISTAILLTGLTFVLLPLSNKIGNDVFSILNQKNTGLINYLYYILIILSPIYPLLVYLTYMIVKSQKGNRLQTFNELFHIFRGKEIETEVSEITSESEPTLREFRNYYTKISSSIQGKSLIIIFDNIDRLSSNKVKELWSAINTFFTGNLNIPNSWIIIPYDRLHINDLFTTEDSSKETVAEHYIQKTFSLSFRVPPPVMTDWKQFFKTKFYEAFQEDSRSEDQLINIFDYLHKDKTIKPREIINYINALVALNNYWKDEIALKYCALFYLTQDLLIKDPYKTILEKGYLKGVESIFENDVAVENNIAAIYFNVPKEKATEVLLKRSIEQSLRGEGDISELFKHPAFLEVLNSVFYLSEINIYIVVPKFNTLPEELKKSEDFKKIWYRIADIYLRTFNEMEFSELVRTLIKNIESDIIRIRIIKFILSNIRTFKVNNELHYHGSRYPDYILKFQNFIDSEKISIQLTDYLEYIEFEPDHFIDAVENFAEYYEDYKIKTNQDQLIEYLNSNIPGDIQNLLTFIKIIKDSDYDISSILEKVEEEFNKISSSTSQDQISGIIELRKIIAKDKPLEKPSNISTFWGILNQFPSHPNKIDIASILIAADQSYINQSVIQNILNDTSNQAKASEIIEFYYSYGPLIITNLSYRNQGIFNIIKSLTEHPVGSSRLSISTILENYVTIKNVMLDGIIDYKVFLNRLSSWSSYYEESFQDQELEKYNSLVLVKDCLACRNDLTKKILNRSKTVLNKITKDQWINHMTVSSTSYMFNLLLMILRADKTIIGNLNNDFIDAYSSTISGIADRMIAVPSNIDDWDFLLSVIESSRLIIPYNNVRDKLLNYNHGPLTKEEMLFFCNGIFKSANLDSKDIALDFVRKFIVPSTSTENTLNKVLQQNRKRLTKIVKKNPAQLPELIEAFRRGREIISEKHVIDNIINSLGQVKK